ncbi:MAG: hypothetical protein IKY78_00030 [Clostridia bacterium]|nr:hypothetical protein [Clostridia bacterium]
MDCITKSILSIAIFLIATIKKVKIKPSKKSKNLLSTPVEYSVEKIMLDNTEYQKIYLKIPSLEIEIILRETILSMLYRIFKA